MTRASLLVFALLAAALCVGAHAADRDCRLKLIASVDMTYDSLGRPTVPVIINGRTVKMLLDTGAFETNVIEQALGELKLHVHKHSGPVAFVSYGMPITESATADTFAFAGMRRDSTELLVLPKAFTAVRGKEDSSQQDDASAAAPEAAATAAQTPDQTEEPIDLSAKEWVGTIGLDILQSFDIELDFGKNKLNLFSPDRCHGIDPVYWTNTPFAEAALEAMPNSDAHVQFHATLDGHGVDALLDTGASHTTTNFAVARLLGVSRDDPLLTDLDGKPLKPDTEVMMRYPFKALSFDALTITNPKINLFPYAEYFNGRLLGGTSTIILGMDVLRRLHIYISYKEGAVYLTPAGS